MLISHVIEVAIYADTLRQDYNMKYGCSILSFGILLGFALICFCCL